MKGLILKDLYMSLKYFKTYLMIILLAIFLSFTQENSLFFAFYPFIICAMLPVSLLSLDERSHWDTYCGTLPVTRDMVVSSKYLLGLILLGAILILNCTIQAVHMVISGTFHWESYLVLISLMVSVSLIASSIPLPFLFKLGVEKGRTAYYVAIGLVCGGSALSGLAFSDDLHSSISFGLVLGLVVLIAAGIYGLSWYLSIRFYRKRDLH